MKFRVLILGLLFILTFLIFTAPNIAAHPGNTASDGCHFCRTNCEIWGYTYDTRHGHHGETCDPSKGPIDPLYVPTPPPTTPPTIIGNTPTGSNVPVNTQITVTFSEAMNQASAQSAFSTSSATTGSFSWSGNTMTYTPSSYLAYSTSYTVTIGTGAKDLAGNNLQSTYSRQFSTVLTPPPTTGSLSVSSTPSGARIYLDGSYQGKTPKTFSDVSVGSHYIELKLEGYNLWSDRINVMTGSTSYISVQLIPTATIPTISPTYTILPPPIPSSTSSVNFHGEKTDVVLSEDILLKLSAVNLITKPKMHVQVIIIPPSGMSVTSSEFSKSGAGQFTANYELEPGDGRDIEVRIKSNQVGDFNVKGRIVYYFGEEKDKAEDQTLNLPIKVRKEIASTPGSIQNTGTKPAEKSPGFEIILAGVGMFLALSFRRR